MKDEKLKKAIRESKPKTYSELDIIKKIEEFRKKECFCNEIDDGDKSKCYICQVCDDILSKFLTPSGFRSVIKKSKLKEDKK